MSNHINSYHTRPHHIVHRTVICVLVMILLISTDELKKSSALIAPAQKRERKPRERTGTITWISHVAAAMRLCHCAAMLDSLTTSAGTRQWSLFVHGACY